MTTKKRTLVTEDQPQRLYIRMEQLQPQMRDKLFLGPSAIAFYVAMTMSMFPARGDSQAGAQPVARATSPI
jgi:hypothetical protein